MRLLLVLASNVAAALCLAFMGFAGSASASHTPTSAGNRDFAAGGGSTFAWRFGFGATGITSEADGGDPHGAVNFQGLGPTYPTFHGRVTCLAVLGNIATVGGAAEIVFPPFGTFHGFAFVVQDNGEPVGGQPVDLFGAIALLPSPPPEEGCVFPLLFPPVTPLSEGNVTVHDSVVVATP